MPGLDLYLPLLKMLEPYGHGRVRAQQQQVIFQQLLIVRREHAFENKINYAMALEAITKKLKRLHIEPGLTYWLAEHALYMHEHMVGNDPWPEIRAIL